MTETTSPAFSLSDATDLEALEDMRTLIWRQGKEA
jgi:hypothetical protein